MKPFPYTLNPDEIPTRKIVDITPEYDGASHVNYACPDVCCHQHFNAWKDQWGKKNRSAPQPQPFRHCMFDNPEGYGMIRYGDASLESKRKAITSHVRAMLSGWIDDAPEDRREAIIAATVEAKMQGTQTGSAPFLAALMAA